LINDGQIADSFTSSLNSIEYPAERFDTNTEYGRDAPAFECEGEKIFYAYLNDDRTEVDQRFAMSEVSKSSDEHPKFTLPFEDDTATP
jgi:hypothetical protein